MNTVQPSPDPMRAFVGTLTRELMRNHPDSEYPPALRTALGTLVAQDHWLPDNFAQPGPDTYRQYLLYCDPLERFSVVSFVWGAGQQTPIHDHTVWGAIGQLRGTERSTPFSFDERGRLTPGREQSTSPGEVIAFTPADGDIHQVINPGPETAVSIHVYGANIGRVTRSVFDPKTGEASAFISGYSNRVLPNIWES